jgi:hypothetical protein
MPRISRAQIRTERRAPVWGSEFTIKAATLQRDSVEFIPGPMLVEVDPVDVAEIRRGSSNGKARW